MILSPTPPTPLDVNDMLGHEPYMVIYGPWLGILKEAINWQKQKVERTADCCTDLEGIRGAVKQSYRTAVVS